MPADHPNARPTRPLPGAPKPHAGESWASYLARLAASYRCTPDDIQRHLGTRSDGTAMTSQDAEHAAAILQVDPAHIHAMHLDRWAGIAFPNTPTSANRRRQPWTHLRQPRSCPTCLHEHGWGRLIWFLPWITSCLEHGHYLADSTKQPLPASRRSIGRTQAFLRALNNQPCTLLGTKLAAGDVFDIWRCAIRLAHQCHQLDGVPRSPSAALDCDTTLEAVEPLLSVDTIEQGAEVIARWCYDGGITKPYRSRLRAVTHPVLKDCLARAAQTGRPASSEPHRHRTSAQHATINWLIELGVPVTPERVTRLRPYVRRYPPGSSERAIAEALIRGDRAPTAQAVRAARWA